MAGRRVYKHISPFAPKRVPLRYRLGTQLVNLARALYPVTSLIIYCLLLVSAQVSYRWTSVGIGGGETLSNSDYKDNLSQTCIICKAINF